MARFRLSMAFNFGSVRLKAGKTICDSQGAAQPGDTVWTGLNAQTIGDGFEPLDGSATTLKNSSRFAGQPARNSIDGVHSIDA
jgi:hypothetical protein